MPTFSLLEISCCAVQRPGGGVSRIWSLPEEQRLWGGANGLPKDQACSLKCLPAVIETWCQLYAPILQYLINLIIFPNCITCKLIGMEKDRQQPLELHWRDAMYHLIPSAVSRHIPLIRTTTSTQSYPGCNFWHITCSCPRCRSIERTVRQCTPWLDLKLVLVGSLSLLFSACSPYKNSTGNLCWLCM